MNEKNNIKNFLDNEREEFRDGSFERPHIDSSLSREEALNHPECPPEILERQELVTLKYRTADNSFHEGQIVVDKRLAKDVEELFSFLYTLPEDQQFPIESVKPIVMYNWDDEASMSANNSSGFNYRPILGQEKLSYHAKGLAIDLNPKWNPLVEEGKEPQPKDGEYIPARPGTLTANHPVVEFMKARGWEWGGDWESYQDYQHFQKIIDDNEKI
jgi:peptidoglycan LD-endopeptidase CwlK